MRGPTPFIIHACPPCRSRSSSPTCLPLPTRPKRCAPCACPRWSIGLRALTAPASPEAAPRGFFANGVSDPQRRWPRSRSRPTAGREKANGFAPIPCTSASSVAPLSFTTRAFSRSPARRRTRRSPNSMPSSRATASSSWRLRPTAGTFACRRASLRAQFRWRKRWGEIRSACFRRAARASSGHRSSARRRCSWQACRRTRCAKRKDVPR